MTDNDSTPLDTLSEADTFITLGMAAIVDTFVGRDVPPEEVTANVQDQLDTVIQTLKGKTSLSPVQVQGLVADIQLQRSHATLQEVTRRNIARWFEVPLEEFDQTPASRLEPDVLFNHLYYESLFMKWFKEWGYEVDAGEELEGSEGTDFTPDLFAQIATLHGNFQIAVCFICDSPPSHYRVLAMLENIEAYTRREKEFGERDMLMLVTPHKFLGQTDDHIRIQSQEEPYFVVALEGEELHDLQYSVDSTSRRSRLQHCVIQAASRDRSF